MQGNAGYWRDSFDHPARRVCHSTLEVSYQKDGRMNMSGSLICLVFAFVLFVLGAASRWWTSPNPYHPHLISAGLAFWVLATLLPMIK